MDLTRMTMRLEQKTPGTYDLYICDEIMPDIETWFGVSRSDTSQKTIIKQLEETKSATQLNICINSVGGSVKEGYGIYTALLRHPAHKTAYIDGIANSIASIIAMAADEIVMYPHSTMGIHNMAAHCMGNAAEHRKTAEDLDKMMEGCRQIYLARSGEKLTEDRLMEMLDAETILTPRECLEYGLCDRIEEVRREGAPAPETPPAEEPPESPEEPQQKTLSQFFDTWR